MQRPVASPVVAAPNVVPMIDVMLVLLIIFMVVTPALQSGIVAEPPVGENLQPRPEEKPDHTLAIDRGGAFHLDRRPVAVDRLPAALAELYPSGTTSRVLYVRAHRELPYGQVRDALEMARGAGVTVAGLVTERRNP